MNKYLRWFLLRWISLEIRFSKEENKPAKRIMWNNIYHINHPWWGGIHGRILEPKNKKYLEHYEPIDWIQRRIDFKNEPMPKDSQVWADMDREQFMDTANPLTPGEQEWADLRSTNLDVFYEKLKEEETQWNSQAK